MTRSYHTSRPAPLTLTERMKLKEQKRQAKEQRQAEKEARQAAKTQIDKYAGLKYDYGNVDDADREVVQQAALAIKMRQRRAAADLIEIGQYLNDIKGMLAHGKFEDWV